MNQNPQNKKIRMDDIVGESKETIRAAEQKPAQKGKSERKRFLNFKFIAVSAAIIFILAISLNSFSSVLINVVPLEKTLEIEDSYKAGLGTGAVNLEKFVFQEKFSEIQPTSQTKNIQEKANGKIIVYNGFSSEPQVFVANTRFESTGGKIYRIDKKITVPGAKIIGGKIEPSLIEAVVFADKAGEEYNIGPDQFTVPGLKDTPKYKGFYAKSKTEIKGGFSGTTKIAAKSDFDALKEKILSRLEKIFEEKTDKGVPANFLKPILAKKITIIKETFEPQIGKPGESARLEIESELGAFGVLKKELEDLLVVSNFGKEFKNKIKVSNLDQLSVSARNINFEKGELDLLVKGKTKFVWQIDQNKLKDELINREDKKIEEVFALHSEIKQATVFFRPGFWRIFPKDSDKIILKIEN